VVPEQADQHLGDIHDRVERPRADLKLDHHSDELAPNLRSILLLPHVIFYRLSNQHCARIAIRHADVLPSQSPAQNEKMAQQSHELSEGSQN